MEVPLVGQLRIIHQGRFLEDNKALSEHKVVEGEQTAMHLIIKSEVAKPAGEECSGSFACVRQHWPLLLRRRRVALHSTEAASLQRCIHFACIRPAAMARTWTHSHTRALL